MNIFTVLWAVIGLAIFLVETVALVRKERGDTLTEHIRELMKHRWFQVAFGIFWVWLSLHFFVPGLGL